MKIRAKQGYNVELNDIKVSLQTSRDWVLVDDEVFKNSIDAKSLMKYIEICADDVETKSEVSPKVISNTMVKQTNTGAFIIGTNDGTPVMPNSFVADPNNELSQVANTVNPINHKVNAVTTPEPAKEVVKAAEKETVKEVVKETVKEPVKELVKEVAKELVKESAKEVVNEPAKTEPVKENVQTTEIKPEQTENLLVQENIESIQNNSEQKENKRKSKKNKD